MVECSSDGIFEVIPPALELNGYVDYISSRDAESAEKRSNCIYKNVSFYLSRMRYHS